MTCAAEFTESTQELSAGESVLITVPASGTPPVVDSVTALSEALAKLEKAQGPIALDTERACGIRYGDDAYLVQVKRGDTPPLLFDPVKLAGKFGQLAQVIDGPEWILHAADQDLPCLANLGLKPRHLYDTEVAAEILGDKHVGLGAVVEKELKIILAKEYTRVDWSKRPLPGPWLNYAALDVEFLAEVREKQIARLQAMGRLEWAQQEFEYIRLSPPPAKRPEPWRHVKGATHVKTARGRQILRNLYEARDSAARERNIAPGRVLSNFALVEAAVKLPRSRAQLAQLSAFKTRAQLRRIGYWWRAVERAWDTPEDKLPAEQGRRLPGTIPRPHTWNSSHSDATARLELIRTAVQVAAAEIGITAERLLMARVQWRLAWDGPKKLDPDAIAAQLLSYGARPWQTTLMAPVISATLACQSA